MSKSDVHEATPGLKLQTGNPARFDMAAMKCQEIISSPPPSFTDASGLLNLFAHFAVYLVSKAFMCPPETLYEAVGPFWRATAVGEGSLTALKTLLRIEHWGQETPMEQYRI